jgi:hypothetical protein
MWYCIHQHIGIRVESTRRADITVRKIQSSISTSPLIQIIVPSMYIYLDLGQVETDMLPRCRFRGRSELWRMKGNGKTILFGWDGSQYRELDSTLPSPSLHIAFEA